MLASAKYRIFIKGLGSVLKWCTFFASIICITALILFIGLFHNETSLKVLTLTVKLCQTVFLVNILFNLIFRFRTTLRHTRRLKWILDFLVLSTIFSLLFPYPVANFNSPVLDVYYSHWFIYTLLFIYSVFELSIGIAGLFGKKTNPSLILAGSFVFFIIIGTLTLMLPKCTVGGISFIDSLFIATSAVSITGLTTIDIASVFTPLGIGILAALIQIGALGVLTFTSFFAMFFSGETSIYNQLMVKDMVYSKTANNIVPTLLYIFLFTLSIEVIGAVGIYFSLPPDFPITEINLKILFSAFQSLSAFCNAGFTWVSDGMSNPSLMNSNQFIYIIMGTLVLMGGIGFPILVNLKNIIFTYFRRFSSFLGLSRREEHKIKHIYDVNTKIVLITSLSITALTIVLFLIFEWNNTLSGMNLWHKLSQAYFNASIPRSSGFASVNPAGFMPSTLLLIMFLMWIGGSSQSTAGGVKVNTFACMLLNLKSIITNHKYIEVFKRTISVMSVRRANAVIGISILSYFLLLMLLIILEPAMSLKDLAFEAASALFTVGSSLGITSALGTVSKLLLCMAMFAGRVGLLSLLMGLAKNREENTRIFPYDNVIIN